MLRNSKNSNSSRSFQSRTSKNNRVISSNISVILKPERSSYDYLSKRYRLHKLTYILTNEHPDTMLILCFLDSPDPKTCKFAKNWKSKIFTISKVHHTTVWWGINNHYWYKLVMIVLYFILGYHADYYQFLWFLVKITLQDWFHKISALATTLQDF